MKKCIYFFIIRILYWLLYPFQQITKLLRKLGIIKNFAYLNKFRGIHTGERCFILLTGPSLTINDVIKLKEKKTIGVNSLCSWFKELNWSTDYFVISDREIFERFHKIASKTLSPEKIFISSYIKKYKNFTENYSVFPIDNRNRILKKKRYKKISKDISVCSYDGESVVIHAIQIAVFMGFKEICLLGADCNYDQEKHHAIDNGICIKNKNIGYLMIEDYKFIKEFTDRWGIKIVNCSRGGKLEVFERVELDSLI